ncbi:hypothetical protein [Alienimonas californiensis]|uniref:SGNH hydrolase-type esterase domain-containing protein n=1 Tax=Alienimonas californiensis TaxID=2527989 RepID=A0A517PF84_9PLAN|nr:hypothetical protein [Alienimonas californiensis]QDT18047.1 hypothetical protein CA12_41860 [Alienimonas californiensis]
MPTRPPRLRPLLLAVGLLPLAVAGVELGVRAADSYSGGALSRPPCPTSYTVPSPLARHALSAFGHVIDRDPDTGATHEVSLNSLGLRGGEAAMPKPIGVRRVLLLGDEATFAAGLPEEETFAGRLVPALSAAAARATPGASAEVINAAIPGDCPLLSVLRLRRLGALQPDLILLCVRPSDLAEDARYRRDLLTDEDGRPVACPHPAVAGGELTTKAPTPAWWRDSLAVRLAGRALAGPDRCPLTGEPLAPAVDPLSGGPQAALAAEQALTPLTDLTRMADGLGVRAALVLLPDGPGGGSAGNSAAVRLILDAAAAAELRAYNAALVLAGTAHGDGGNAGPATGPFLTKRGALTRAGHARLAEALAEFLLSAPPADPVGGAPDGGAAVGGAPTG